MKKVKSDRDQIYPVISSFDTLIAHRGLEIEPGVA